MSAATKQETPTAMAASSQAFWLTLARLFPSKEIRG